MSGVTRGAFPDRKETLTCCEIVLPVTVPETTPDTKAPQAVCSPLTLALVQCCGSASANPEKGGRYVRGWPPLYLREILWVTRVDVLAAISCAPNDPGWLPPKTPVPPLTEVRSSAVVCCNVYAEMIHESRCVLYDE